MTTFSLGYPVLSFVPSAFLSQRLVSDWKPEIRLPQSSEYVVLSGLEWNTEYEVHVVAANQQGKSQPGTVVFRTSTEPTTIPGTIPTIPPRASAHISHSAQRLPLRPERLYSNLADCRVWRESSVSAWYSSVFTILISAVSNMYDTFHTYMKMTLLFAESNRQFHVIMYPVCNADGRAVLKEICRILSLRYLYTNENLI